MSTPFFTVVYEDRTCKTFEGEENDTVRTPSVQSHAKQIGHGLLVTLVRLADTAEAEYCVEQRRDHANKLRYY